MLLAAVMIEPESEYEKESRGVSERAVEDMREPSTKECGSEKCC